MVQGAVLAVLLLAQRHEEIRAGGLAVDLPEIGVALPLAELYAGFIFEAEQDADQAPRSSISKFESFQAA